MHNDRYDLNYSHPDYFKNRKWINDVYVKNLIRKSGIPLASCFMDVGCGQGHFSYLFNKYGMQVFGIDLNETGVRYAQRHYEKKGLHFAVCDAFAIPVSTKFDCVFTRSLYI